MRRNLRFYFALIFARGTALVLKIIGRKGTSMPGSWAIILCPDFLGRMPRPKTVIGITGTNGKTTVANMVEDVLESEGYDFMCNRSGTNVNTGVASTLISNSHFWGKPKKDLAIFELDERSAPKILPYIKPDIMLCTNIFRDSYKRNAHMEFITEILDKYIPDETKLVLNGDDLLCSGLKKDNERVYFGIKKQDGENNESHNIVMDIRNCPNCGAILQWDFIRYHHIGRATCPKCGFKSPELDYLAHDISADDSKMMVNIEGKEQEFPLANSNLINTYNSLSAIAFLSEFGLEPERISNAMKRLTINETRYMEEEVEGKKVILHLAKGQNPVACSRVFENVRDYEGRKSLILFLDDYWDAKHSVENVSWYYDTDFEFLNDDSITQIIAAGARHWDVYVRLLMAGVPEDRIIHIEEYDKAALEVDPSKSDTTFILYDVYTIGLANDTKEQVKEVIKKNADKGGKL